MEKELLELYTLAEMRYQDHFKNVDSEDLYPSNWYLNKNYKLKIEIIAEAIKNDTLIVNTKSYLKIVEGYNN